MKKFGYLELAEIPWDFFFLEIFLIQSISISSENGIKIIWIFGISGEARGFKYIRIVRKYNARLKGNNCTEVKFFFKEIIRRDNIRE